MNDNKVHFKQALKKQIWTVVITIGSVIAYPMIIGGLTTDLKFYSWIFLIFASSYLVFIVLKKQSKEALCPHCKSDLFEVIEKSKHVKLDFNFCPCCGERIEL